MRLSLFVPSRLRALEGVVAAGRGAFRLRTSARQAPSVFVPYSSLTGTLHVKITILQRAGGN
jgi:hypothetical protein